MLCDFDVKSAHYDGRCQTQSTVSTLHQVAGYSEMTSTTHHLMPYIVRIHNEAWFGLLLFNDTFGDYIVAQEY